MMRACPASVMLFWSVGHVQDETCQSSNGDSELQRKAAVFFEGGYG